MMVKRESWGSRIGFIFAVAGSAVGLGNIWRFPHIVGTHGGAAFIAVYLICLLLIGFPILISEILIGRTTKKTPSGAFLELGRTKQWAWVGKMTILTGFIVSSFYSAVAGWVLGYLFEALFGQLTRFSTHAEATLHYELLMHNPVWTVGFQALFLLLTVSVLFFGVRKGIERGNKIMMPLLFFILFFLAIKGSMMPNSLKGLSFLLAPVWSDLTPTAIIIALGQAFFTLSLGQGTMVTYGSYLAKRDNVVKNCIPVVAMDTLSALLAAIAVFTIVFSAGLEPGSGPGLIFQTLPLVFSQMTGGYFFALLFFLLVFLAALSSEISAMEPSIAFLIEKGWSRKKAVIVVGLGVFLLGVPSAISFSLLKEYTFFGHSFLGLFDFAATSLLIPIGGFFAVYLVGWRWGFAKALLSLKEGADDYFKRNPWLIKYLWFCIKFTAPLLIVILFLQAIS